MTQTVIGDILPYTQAIATLGQTVFGTNWTANYATDVDVYYTPFGEPAFDLTQQLSTSDFTIAFIGALQQVQVTLVVAAAAGDRVTIVRNTPADRLNLYSNTNFTPSMLNNDFGILTLVDQQAQLVDQKIGPRYNYSAIINPLNVDEDTILPILGPDQVWMKNDDNDAIIAVDFAMPGSGGGNISEWITVIDPSVNAEPTQGFVADRTATPVQVVLPALFEVGDSVAILGLGTGGWTMVANAAQTIKFGSQTTSVAGSISSDITNATIFVRGLVANTTWIVETVNSNPTFI